MYTCIHTYIHIYRIFPGFADSGLIAPWILRINELRRSYPFHEDLVVMIIVICVN